MAGDIPHYGYYAIRGSRPFDRGEEQGANSTTPDLFRNELEALYRLHAAKRSDYTADSGDILANYRFSASMMGVPIERGMFGRMCEKVFRLKSLFEKGTAPKVSDETAADTLRDIAIIAILMRIEMLNGEAK